MLYNIEVAQSYSAEHIIKQDSFYRSMLKSFREAIAFIDGKGLYPIYSLRIKNIAMEARTQNWINQQAFDN
jgi:hypothetical protein